MYEDSYIKAALPTSELNLTCYSLLATCYFSSFGAGKSVAICEATTGDRYEWGNARETEPAFLVYLGCSEAEISGYLKTINTFYRCSWSEIRKPKYLSEFEAEIKIRGMQRYADSHAFGLDYLVESESAKHIGCDSDEYNYYTTGYMPRW